MSKAILTIDDAPTKITPKIIDYLRSKNIVPVINFVGSYVEDHFEEALYAVKSGIVIGNHGFCHEHFSEMTLQECREDIAKAEKEINRVYEYIGMKREHRVFRFPYGDKGGANAVQLQKMLVEEFHFERLDDSAIKFPFWKEHDLDQEISMHWSFDFVEYELAWDNGFTWDTIMKHIHNPNPEEGGPLLGKEDITNIILMHDHEQTNQFMEKYYEKLIDYVLECGVEFVKPQFVMPIAES